LRGHLEKSSPQRRTFSIRARLLVLALVAITPLVVLRVRQLEANWAERIAAASEVALDLARQGLDRQNAVVAEVRSPWHSDHLCFGIANGVDEVRNAVRYMVKYGADVIKICATGGVLSLTDSAGVQQYSEEEMRAIVETATQLDRRVAAHAHGTAGIKAAVRAGVTSIEHGSILDAEAVTLMKQHGTWLVPTLLAGFTVESLANAGRLPPPIAAKALAIAPRMHNSFKLALDGGVKIALGTDSAVAPHTLANHEVELMVTKGGMTPRDALIAATKGGPDLIGVGNETGTLDPGKSADLIAVAGDPLVDPTAVQRVDYVMVEGRPIPMKGQ